MSAQIGPSLCFGGRSDEALEFYRQAIGVEVLMKMRHSDNPQPLPPGAIPPGWEDKVMHASIRPGTSTVMASDGCDTGTGFSGFSWFLSMATDVEVDRLHAALAEGGKGTMPPSKTFWSPRFGMLEDKFGVGRMITVAGWRQPERKTQSRLNGTKDRSRTTIAPKLRMKKNISAWKVVALVK